MVLGEIALLHGALWKAPLSLVLLLLGVPLLVGVITKRGRKAQLDAEHAEGQGLYTGDIVLIDSAIRIYFERGFLFGSVLAIVFAVLLWSAPWLAATFILLGLLSARLGSWQLGRRLKGLDMDAYNAWREHRHISVPTVQVTKHRAESTGGVFDYQTQNGRSLILILIFSIIFYVPMAVFLRNPEGGTAEILAPVGIVLFLLLCILRVLFGYLRERIVVSAETVTWYDWLGKRKLQVERTQIARKPENKFWTIHFGTVFPTPKGILRFSKELRGYDRLLASLTSNDGPTDRFPSDS